MKKSIWMVIGILAVIVVAAHYADKATRLPHTTSASLAKPDAPGGEKPAPDVTLKDLDGKDVSIAQYKGKIVLVHFLAPGWDAWPALPSRMRRAERNLRRMSPSRIWTGKMSASRNIKARLSWSTFGRRGANLAKWKFLG